jgi:hypothetical protein
MSKFIYIWSEDLGTLSVLVPDDATDAQQIEAANAAQLVARAQANKI